MILREVSRAHAKRLVDSHDQLLQSVLETGSYKKLYSFNHVINGFSVHITESQVMIGSSIFTIL